MGYVKMKCLWIWERKRREESLYSKSKKFHDKGSYTVYMFSEL